MLPVLLALLGVPVGVVLDVLIERLAVREHNDEVTTTISVGSLNAETGTLVIGAQDIKNWPRRLAVAVATAGLFAIAAARYESAAELIVVCAYVCVLLICAGTDLLSYRVPNVVTYPAIIGAFVVALLLPDADFLSALFGGLLAGGVLLIPALFTGGVGMGMGDVKLALFAGLALGFELVPAALLVMALGGGLVASILLLSGKRKRGQPIPYAPFISAGALVALLGFGSAFASFS